MTLLDQALKAKHVRTNARTFSDEDYELVTAWLTGRISTQQVAAALAKPQSSVSNYVSRCVKEMVEREYLVLNPAKHGAR